MKQNVNYAKLRKSLMMLLEQGESDDVYRISPEEYLQLLKLSDNSPGFTRIKKFGGKPLYITGSLDVSNKPITTLGNVAYIDGNLSISNTNISSLPDNLVKGYILDSNTPREIKRLRAQDEKWLSENQERKENKEWEVGKSDEANKVNALFIHLVDIGDIDILDDNEKDELIELKKRYARIEKEYNETEDPDEESELYDKLIEIEGDIEGLEERNYDVYNTIHEYGGHYDLNSYTIIPLRTRNNFVVYTVGTENEMESSYDDYWKSYIDDVGLGGLNAWVTESCIDEDSVVSYAEEEYYEDISQNPESFFKDSDFELTDEQEKRQEDLENYISELEDYISDLEDKQNRLDDEIDEPEEFSKVWDEIQQLIDDAEEKKDKAQDELDSIEPDTEPTEDMIQSKVDDNVEWVRRNPIDYLKDRGLDIKYYVDMDCVIEELKRNGDYGDMNGYDGTYDSEYVDDNQYYIMRIE
jgi:hypothetical protein